MVPGLYTFTGSKDMCSIEAGEPSVQRRNAGKNGGAFGDNDKLGIENSVRYSCRTAGYKKSGSSCDGFAETFCDRKDGCSNTGNRKCCEYDYRIGAY